MLDHSKISQQNLQLCSIAKEQDTDFISYYKDKQK